jgi:hypothetical protein
MFIAALNSGKETFAGISYTEVYTHNDEEVQPNMDNSGTSSLHTGDGRITNVAVQDICPADPVEHLGLGPTDSVAYALTIDALNHDGPADPGRIATSVCTQPLMPGVNPVTFPADAGHAAFDVETSSGDTVTQEPPLACYVTASCRPGGAGAAPGAGPLAAPVGCANPRHLIFRLHAGRARVTGVRVYVDGRRVKVLRGRRLTRVRLPALPGQGVHTVKIVTRASDHRRRVTIRRYRACAQRRRVTRPPRRRHR